LGEGRCGHDELFYSWVIIVLKIRQPGERKIEKKPKTRRGERWKECVN